MKLLTSRIKSMLITFILLSATALGAVAYVKEPAKATGDRLERFKNSPQWEDGKFRNELDQTQGSLWEMITATFTNNAKHTAPTESLPIVERKKSEFDTPPESGLRTTWLGHSTVLIEIDNYKVLTDPVWSERASPFSFLGPKRFHEPPLSLNELPSIDAVVISHDHFDHLDEATIKALKNYIPKFVVPLGIGAHLEEWGVDGSRIVELDWWEDIKLGELTLTATPARHFSGRSLVNINLNETLWSGWSIAGPKHNVYYSGDTAMFPGFSEIGERLGPFDLTMIELGAYNALWPDVHIGPEQALQAHKIVRGKVMMPVHWATFDLAMHNWTEPVERLMNANKDAQTTIVFPKPGESFDPTNPPSMVKWWPELPWQNAEEAPLVSTGLDSEVAQLENKEVFEGGE